MKQHPVTLVAGLHGNEYFPVLALASAGVPFVIGNPKALARGKRFYQSDLNASFGVRGRYYESQRAQEILRHIPKHTKVVDFHTSVAAQKPFVIIVDPKQLPFALTLGIPRIVYMKHNIKKGHALINYRSGASVEVGRDDERQSFERTLKVVESVTRGKQVQNAKLYEVYGKITKKGKYLNFRMHKDGFIPILAGETSYKFYGLKARRVKAFL